MEAVTIPTMQKKPIFAPREMLRSDRAFICNSWLKSYRTEKKDVRTGVYFRGQHDIISEILDRDGVTVIVMYVPSQGEDAIAGWICFEDDTLHYVYLKGAYRGFGLSKVLLEVAGIKDSCRYSHKTQMGLRRLKPPDDWVYDPYA